MKKDNDEGGRGDLSIIFYLGSTKDQGIGLHAVDVVLTAGSHHDSNKHPMGNKKTMTLLLRTTSPCYPQVRTITGRSYSLRDN